ncbi:MAG: hypothetical protein V2J62_00945 [candidate division KSB1 bacterium]|jgi:hypothetical protein|nr:hypothetical protein [candidate division KSB1 bacterium]
MKTTTKTSLILMVTLLAGMLVGVLLDRTLLRHEFRNKVAGVRDPKGVIRLMERIIEPDEDQYEQIMDIVSKHSKQMHAIGDSSRKQIEAVMDSMKKEIDPVLTDEQKARLERRIERMQQWRRDGHRRPGPRFEGKGKFRDRPPLPPDDDGNPPPPPPSPMD